MRQMQIALVANKRKRHEKYQIIGCLLALFIINMQRATATWAASDRPPSGTTAPVFSGLQFHNGLLTARVKAIPLPQVLSTLSRLSGTRVVWLGQPDLRQVSVTFSALPVAEAIQRILGANNFLLVYASTAEQARLKEIWIATRPSPTQTGLSSPVEFTPASKGGTGIESDDAFTQESAPLPDERTAHEIEAEVTGMLESQLDTAVHGDDPSSRVQAIEVLGGMMEQDARIRPVLQQLSSSERDPQIRTAAAEMLGELEE